MREPTVTAMAGAIFCQACLIRCCPVHLGIFRPAPPMQVHYAGCHDQACTGCLPPEWVHWDREARDAREARGE